MAHAMNAARMSQASAHLRCAQPGVVAEVGAEQVQRGQAASIIEGLTSQGQGSISGVSI